MWLQCCANPVNHSHGSIIVPGGLTTQSPAADSAQHGGTTRQGVHHIIEDITLLAGSSLLYGDPTTLGPPIEP
jgi:hypothetical protein